MKSNNFNSKFLISIFLITTYIGRILGQQCVSMAGTCNPCGLGTYSVGNAACVSCISNAVSSCSSVTGLATSCFPGFGLSSTGACTICPTGTFSLGMLPCNFCPVANCSSMTGNIVTATTTGCTVANAASCDSVNLGNIITCTPGYVAVGNMCATIHARFTSADWASGVGNMIAYPSIGEATCQSTCSVTPGYWATTWVANSTTCICRTLGPAGLKALVLSHNTGLSVNFVGSCSNYTGLDTSFSNLTTTCQNVYYSNVGCLGVDGTSCNVLPTIGCTTIYTLTCDPVTHNAIQCYPAYGLSNTTCVGCSSNTWSNGTTSCNVCTGVNSTACSQSTGLSTACTTGYSVVNGVCTSITGSVTSGCIDQNAASCDALTLSISQSCNSGYGLAGFPAICVACLSGTYSPSGSNTTCSSCPSGQYSGALAASCTNCLPNFGSASCGPFINVVKTCHAGYGMTNGICQSCLGGYASPEGSNSSCSICPPGSFASPGSASCTLCAISSIAATAGSTVCTSCRSAYTSPAGGTVCALCPPGTFQDSNGNCPSCLTIGAASCGPILNTTNTCHAGYGLVGGACQICIGGYASAEGLASPCQICPIGTSALPGSSSCTPCAIGTSAGTLGSSTCSSCATGSTSISGATSCTPITCHAGFGLLNGICQACIGGYSSPEGSGVACTICAAGSFALPQSSSCTPCSINTIAATAGLSNCTACTTGTKANVGATACATTTCNAGYGLVNSACIGCTAGFFAAAGSSSPCTACSVGQFSATLASACTPCAINTFTNSTGSSSCTPCSAGQTATTGATSCSTCAAGTYENTNGTCVNCLSTGVATCGPVNIAANTCITGYGLVGSTCTGCTAGFYAAAGSSSACTACSVGQFSAALASACTPCAINTFTNSTGSPSCAPCSAGQTATTGATSCSTCAAGTYENTNGICVNCLSTGVATCGPVNIAANTCTAGYGLVGTTCTGCTAGFFAAAGSSSACTACSAGQFSIALASACTPCAINTFANSTGSSKCYDCPIYQSSILGSINCVAVTSCIDKYAVTCSNSSTSGASLTCVQYYTAISAVCQPTTFARYYTMHVGGPTISGDLGSTDEVHCVAQCTLNNLQGGPLLGVEFVAGTKNCYCLLSTDQNVMFTIGNSNTASKSPAAGFYTMFVGTCSSYPLVNNTIYPCQTVTYPLSKCTTIDNSGLCKL